MNMDPAMPLAVGATLLILLTGIVLKLAKQPHVIAYLIAGVLIGPWGLEFVTDADIISRLGAIGVVLLLFFVGMETDAAKLVANWKLTVFGTFLQILLSVASVWLLGLIFDWSLSRTVLIGFVISISCTAIVIKLLQDDGIFNTKIGQSVLGILLAQDLAIIPMLIILGLLSSGEIDTISLVKQGGGTIAAALIFGYILSKKQIHLPLAKWLKQDHELQLFAALTVCFGLSLLTAWLNLSTALGAFIGGMIIGAAKETQWVHHTLDSFRVLFVALFFVSVGLMLDIGFLAEHWPQALALTVAALLTNTFINAFILRAAEYSWNDSLYVGLVLSQLGEFSFVLAAVGIQAAIINQFGYQLALCVISLSLLLSPLWIAIGKRLLKWDSKTIQPT